MQHLRVVTHAAQSAFNIQHTAQVAQHHSLCTGRLYLLALVGTNCAGNLAILQGERATKTASLPTVFHFKNFYATHFANQGAGLILHTQLAQPTARIMIGNLFKLAHP